MGSVHDTTVPATLVAQLATLPDPRNRRGRRYEWRYLLTLIAPALMSGESTLVGISQWLSAHQDALLSYLPTKRKTLPSLATVRRVLGAIDLTALEGAVGIYLQGLRGAMGDSGQVVTLLVSRRRQPLAHMAVLRAQNHQSRRRLVGHIGAGAGRGVDSHKITLCALGAQTALEFLPHVCLIQRNGALLGQPRHAGLDRVPVAALVDIEVGGVVGQAAQGIA
ncbi:MAG: hypothetical protein DCC55_39470 [Chloroflexi bacterium]|nr:MAG: hypothetical protein DCC55_39470 [Chloroflexota bacterium]